MSKSKWRSGKGNRRLNWTKLTHCWIMEACSYRNLKGQTSSQTVVCGITWHLYCEEFKNSCCWAWADAICENTLHKTPPAPKNLLQANRKVWYFTHSSAGLSVFLHSFLTSVYWIISDKYSKEYGGTIELTEITGLWEILFQWWEDRLNKCRHWYLNERGVRKSQKRKGVCEPVKWQVDVRSKCDADLQEVRN